MFRDKRTTDPDQATRDDYTTADDGIVLSRTSRPTGPMSASRRCLSSRHIRLQFSRSERESGAEAAAN
jgi:hypothetical protein